MNASPATNTNSQNLDLAALIEREEATHLVAYTSPAPTVEAPPKLNDLFAHFLKYKERIESLASHQASIENDLLGQSYTRTPNTDSLRDLANSALRTLIHRAEQSFAPSGGKLSIDSSEVLEETNQSDWERKFSDTWRNGDHQSTQPLDLDAIWKFLEESYGGEAGIKAGYRQQAVLLVKQLNLASSEGMKRTASSVIAVRRLYSEKKDWGPDKGKYEIHHGSRGDLNLLWCAISCFAEWADLDALAIAIHPCRHLLGDYNYAFQSRDKHQFPGLEVVMFKDRMEFRFSHEVAEKLKLFLGSFAT